MRKTVLKAIYEFSEELMHWKRINVYVSYCHFIIIYWKGKMCTKTTWKRIGILTITLKVFQEKQRLCIPFDWKIIRLGIYVYIVCSKSMKTAEQFATEAFSEERKIGVRGTAVPNRENMVKSIYHWILTKVKISIFLRLLTTNFIVFFQKTKLLIQNSIISANWFKLVLILFFQKNELNNTKWYTYYRRFNLNTAKLDINVFLKSVITNILFSKSEIDDTK